MYKPFFTRIYLAVIVTYQYTIYYNNIYFAHNSMLVSVKKKNTNNNVYNGLMY